MGDDTFDLTGDLINAAHFSASANQSEWLPQGVGYEQVKSMLIQAIEHPSVNSRRLIINRILGEHFQVFQTSLTVSSNELASNFVDVSTRCVADVHANLGRYIADNGPCQIQMTHDLAQDRTHYRGRLWIIKPFSRRDNRDERRIPF